MKSAHGNTHLKVCRISQEIYTVGEEPPGNSLNFYRFLLRGKTCIQGLGLRIRMNSGLRSIHASIN